MLAYYCINMHLLSSQMATKLHSSPQEFDGGLAGLSLSVRTGNLVPIAATVEHREGEGGGGVRIGVCKEPLVCELTGI